MNRTDNTLGVLVGNGDGTFLSQQAYPVNTVMDAPVVAFAADVTGDGEEDIVLLNDPTATATSPYNYSLGTFAGNGDGTYQPAALYNFSKIAVTQMAAADFTHSEVASVVLPDGGDYVVDIFANGLHEDLPFTAMVYGSGYQEIVATYAGDSAYSPSTSNWVGINGSGGDPPLPTFTIAANPSSLTLAAGSTDTATIAVTPLHGFSGTLQFACSGLPAYTVCSFSPSSVRPSIAAATTTLTVETNVQTGSNQRPP